MVAARCVYIAVSLLPALAPALSGAEPARGFALRASRIYTGEAVIEGGTVLVIDGKIAAVGKTVELPAGIPVLDLPGRIVERTIVSQDLLRRQERAF